MGVQYELPTFRVILTPTIQQKEVRNYFAMNSDEKTNY